MSDISRPTHLPDFQEPPLNEVLLGVQFSAPKGYDLIRAGEVWNLFRDKYPKVQMQPPLPPTFETFGLPHQRASFPQFNFLPLPPHGRFWFLTESGSELVQFQQDRLIHNWRKVGGEHSEYPRFETMIARFKDELASLETYAASLESQTLAVTQCEITYVNHIVYDPAAMSGPSNWLRFLSFDEKPPEDFSMSFREVLLDDDGKPQSRLQCDAASAVNSKEQSIISLTLSVRGAPKGNGIESTLEFLKAGREVIVQRFAELTTEKAHEKWKRVN